MYLREYGVRGHHNIQDLWSPVVYQVMRAPKEGGVVYMIAPVDDLTKTRNVHRSLVQSRVCKDTVVVDCGSPLHDPVVDPSSLDEDEVDMLAVVQFTVEPEPIGRAPEMGLGPQEWINTMGPVPVIGPRQLCPEGGSASTPEPQPEGLPRADEVVLHRTRPVTAGLHPNRL